MWTHDRLKAKDWKGKGCPTIAQAKMDGHRCTFFKQDDGTTLAFGRDARPHLEMTSRYPFLTHSPAYKWWHEYAPARSSLDCEVYTPSNNPTDVPTALRKGGFFVTPFAVPFWDGHDLADVDVHTALYVLEDSGLSLPETINFDGDATALMNIARKKDMEGWVLKEKNYSGWYKLKDTRTVDCIVTDIQDGEGKYDGLIGAFIVSAYIGGKLVEIGNVSGMDDDTRYLSNTECKGRVVEVRCQGFGSKGRMRHPRFIRFRDDKPAGECICEF